MPWPAPVTMTTLSAYLCGCVTIAFSEVRALIVDDAAIVDGHDANALLDRCVF
jgi:hypothetical protein